MKQLSFPAPIAIGDHQIAVDHVEFGKNHLDHSQTTQEFINVREPGGIIERVPIAGREVLLVQPLTVFLTELADVISHPNQPPPLLIPVTATVFIRLTYTVDGFNQDRLGFTFHHLVMDPLPPLPPGVDGNALQQEFQKFAQDLVPDSNIPLGLAGKITESCPPKTGENVPLPCPSVQIINLGVSTDSDITLLALRVELGDGSEADPQIWQAFFEGEVQNRLQEAGFAIFLTGSLLENIFANQVAAGIAGRNDDRFELVSGVSCTYSKDGGAAKLRAIFSGNVSTPICSVWVDITVDGRLLVNQPNTITADVNLAVQKSTSACVITGAFLGAALGLVANFVVPLAGLILDPILGAMAGATGVLFVVSTQGIGKLPVPDCNQESDLHLVCTTTVPLTKTPLGVLSFDSASAFDDGVSLQGRLIAIPPGAPKLKIEPDAQFRYLPPLVSCGEFSTELVEEFRRDPKAHVLLSAGVNITAESLVPIYLLDAHVVNDPLGIFTNRLAVLGDQAPLSLSFDLGYPGDAYFQNPYPCLVLVSTTGGERLVSIPPPPPLTQTEIDRLGSLLADIIGRCSTLVANWFDGGVFDPQWLVDPGPGDRVVDHYYEFVVNGLAAGELVTLIDSAQQVLVNRAAIGGESLRVDALVTPAANEIGLVRTREGSGRDVIRVFKSIAGAIEGSHKKIARGVGVTEQLIVRVATILLPEACMRLTAAYSEGVPCALAVLPDRFIAFDLSVPSTPTVHFAASVPGLRGVFLNQSSLVVFGDIGFSAVDSRGTRPAICACGGDTAIYGAVGAGSVIYAVTDAGLELFSPRFSRVLTIPLGASGPIARVGNTLVTATHDGLTVFSIANPKRPDRKEGFKMAGIQDLVTPPGGAGQTLLAIANDGTSKLVDFSRGDDPIAVADYPQLPWYVGSARLGTLFLKLVPTRTTIQVSFFGKSQLQ
jgi:hypothetical protein